MPNPLSNDLRDRIVDTWKQDEASYASLAERYGVHDSTVYRLIEHYKKYGSVEPRPHGRGRARTLNAAHRRWLSKQISKSPATTSYELTAALKQRFVGLSVHRSTVLRFMHEIGLTYKKKSR